jgi:hypothetical protein
LHTSEGKADRKRKGKNMSNWQQAKKEIKALGIGVNTRLKSCELGCACVGDEWGEANRGKPTIWQTGKRFSPIYGGYLNHHDLTDTNKLQIMAILGNNGVRFEWDGQSHHTIRVMLGREKA